ncbi:MAG: Uma2 family endonuclease [Chloroflexi bacterium]|nr:Uma2 family endonuclease [Chloroflexota bacterium]
MLIQVEATVRELARSPLLPFVEQRLHALMMDEQKRRAEFHRAVDAGDPRYDGKSIEFINGEVIELMAVQNKHANAGENLFVLLRVWVNRDSLGQVNHEKIMISLSRNDYEPDICFWIKAKVAAFKPNQTRFPAPDFIVEVLSPSTKEIDRGIKFKDYAAHGVGEYWIVDPERETIEQYFLKDEEYILSDALSEGMITNRVIAGFQIPVRAIFDTAANFAALQEIMARTQK